MLLFANFYIFPFLRISCSFSHVVNSLFSRISRSGCYFTPSCLQVWPRRAKTLHWAHTQTSDLRSLTLSPHATTPHLPTQPHPTYSSPRPPLAPSSTHFPPLASSTTHSHPLHGMSTTSVKLCFRNILSEFVRTPVRESTLRVCEFPTLALYQ